MWNRNLDREWVLDHELRVQILMRVRERPGATMREVSSELGIHYTTTKHHANVLSEHGLLQLERRGSRIFLFESGGDFRGAERRLLSRLNLRSVKDVLAVLLRGEATLRALVRETGHPAGSVHWCLARLRDDGVVLRREVPGASPRYAIAAPERDTVARWLATPNDQSEQGWQGPHRTPDLATVP
ncbi:MAG: hypothetical protein ACT4PT_08595 [Methanobacteriota archaeon]